MKKGGIMKGMHVNDVVGDCSMYDELFCNIWIDMFLNSLSHSGGTTLDKMAIVLHIEIELDSLKQPYKYGCHV